jgi:putative transposase
MGLPRSTFYDGPAARLDDAEIVGRMQTICDEFEAYGYRRVGAELRHHGVIVNHKKIRRLMREHDLQPKRRRRYVATTDSDHDSPIFPDRARDLVVDGPNQLWVADITYIAIMSGFAYLAAVLDAWSRRVVGYAISRSIDARLAAAALKAAIRMRRPPEGCVHHFRGLHLLHDNKSRSRTLYTPVFQQILRAGLDFFAQPYGHYR